MRYAIISDIHSNSEALGTVFDKIDTLKIDRILCLGDVVGYGADPSPCLQKIRERCDVVIAGNHDHAVAGSTDSEYFNVHARAAVLWTQEQLSDDDLEYIKNLPIQHEEGAIIAVHANLHNPLSWGYVLDEFDASASFAQMGDKTVCFIGHSHVPVIFEDGEYIQIFGNFSEMVLKKGFRYIVNVGSVGQPRDGIPEASFGVYDSDLRKMLIYRVAYDIKKTSKKIRDAGLPEFLAERLRWGR